MYKITDSKSQKPNHKFQIPPRSFGAKSQKPAFVFDYHRDYGGQSKFPTSLIQFTQ